MGVLIVILDCRSKKRGPTASYRPGNRPNEGVNVRREYDLVAVQAFSRRFFISASAGRADSAEKIN